MEQENKDIIRKSYNGLLVVKARNGNFNAGFDGNPRTLPDGTIFATDKALKYCIREYLATFKSEPVFVRRNRSIKKIGEREKSLAYETLEDNFYNKLKFLKEKGLFKEIDEKKILDKKDGDDESLLKILKSFIDIRMFGVVFSVNANISLTGSVQISYGINKLGNSSNYSSQILSPYKNSNDKSEEALQTTIGEETRADEIYYVYNISVNHANAEKTEMTKEDLIKLKEALLNSVDPITSCTKYGCESVALIWLNNEENLILNNLDEFVEIEKNKQGEVKLKLSRLKSFLENYNFGEIEDKEFKLTNFDLSEKEEDKNKIQVIYKKGKIILEK